MSSDWWANQIGTAAAVTPPAQGVTQYGLAADIGTAPWADARSFRTFVEDTVRVEHRDKIERAQAQKDVEEESWFNRFLGGATSAMVQGVGFIAGGPFQEMDAEQDQEAGRELLTGANDAIEDLPLLGSFYKFSKEQYKTFYTGLSFIPTAASLEDTGEFGNFWFTDGSNWSKAWRLAEDRTPGQALTDWFLTGVGHVESQKDLDRLRRTNSLYGITSFGLDLAVSWKFDPTVYLAKGIGEASRIKAGALPTGEVTRPMAIRAARGDAVQPKGIAQRYGVWRGQRMFRNWDDVFTAAETMRFGEFSNLPMFRARNAVNGAAAAEMIYVAAKHPELRDLTRRAVLADTDAWAQIRAMKDGDVPMIPGGRTYLDALDAQKGAHAKLESEVEELERLAASSPRGSIFDFYNKEVHASYERRLLDLEDSTRHLAQYEDYAAWLDSVPAVDNAKTAPQLTAIKGSRPPIDHIQRTFQTNLFGKAHRIQKIGRAGVLREPNTIDLNRVDSGTKSIRRQFEQFDHLFGYKNAEAMDEVLHRFTRLQQRGDYRGAAMVAKEVEEQHLVAAISSKYGFLPETVTSFLNGVRGQQNSMVNALLSGDGAVYTTADNASSVKIVSREHGMVTVNITDGDLVDTKVFPEEMFDGLRDTVNLAVDPTQTPNYYSPLNTRQVAVMIERDADLFELIDSDIRNFGRRGHAALMEGVDLVGTKWNQFWKPAQLFRLAWPQRVIMDESLRSMAMIGMGPWLRNHGKTFAYASMNAINPLEHPGTLAGLGGMTTGALAGGAVAGPFGFLVGGALGAATGAIPKALIKARHRRIGPGPLSDEVTGRSYDTALHDTVADAAPMVPAYFAPKVSKGRQAKVQEMAAAIQAQRAFELRRTIQEGLGWDAALVDGAIAAQLPLTKNLKRVGGAKGPSSMVVDPTTGGVVRGGYAVPVASARAGALDGDLLTFVQQNAGLLGNQGYRLMVEASDAGFDLHVVRVFRSTESEKALRFGYHTGVDRVVDIPNRRSIPRSEWEVPDDEAAELAQLQSARMARVEEAELNPDFDFDSWLDDPLEQRYWGLLRRREFGRGKTSLRNPITGERITIDDALEGEGEIYEVLMSSAPAYAKLTDSYKRTLNMMRSKAVGYKRLQPPDVTPNGLRTRAGREAAAEYYSMWADLLNDQLRNSPIWFRMLDGKTDEQIIAWLRNTAEGARYRKMLPHKGYDPHRWVEEHRQALDRYLPDANMQRLLRERKLKASELRRIPQDRMPEVFGADLQLIEGTGIGKLWHNIVENVYKGLGTVPTDTLVRQPFFRAVYQMRMRNLVAATDPEKLTDEVLMAFQRQSREFALNQVKRTLYELGDDTNFTQALRFIAPFWGAQQEALVKWLNIAVERPETVARFYLGMDQVYERFTIVDEDGKPVKRPTGEWEGFGYDPNHRIIFQVPKALRKWGPFKKMLAGQTRLGVAFGSANTALQGDKPFLPGLGPIVALPADKFLDAMWETQGTQFDDNFFYRWIFPVGRPPAGVEGALEFLMPGWGRRMEQWRKGEDSRTYLNTFTSVYREMERDHRRRGLPEPTAQEVQNAVNWHYALRVIASFGGPVAVEWRPKHQLYLDQYHAMQERYGPRAFDKFVEKFGADAARYAASSSENIGVPPTSEGMSQWQANRALIQKLVDSDREELVSAVIGPDAWADDFSSDAYQAQFNINVGPGSTTKLARPLSLEERLRQTDERLGWVEYRKFTSAINAELAARGLTSIQNRGAEDLLALSRAKKAELAEQYPAWGDAMNDYSNNIYGIVDTLAEIADRKEFDNRPEWQGVRQYLVIRSQVAQELDRYYAETGGSRSLQAQENTALREWFYSQVGQLVLDNPMFGEFYVRYLDNDTLERGSG